MDKNLYKLYTGEVLSKDEEIQLINQRISELELDISINETVIEADKMCIEDFNKRLINLQYTKKDDK